MNIKEFVVKSQETMLYRNNDVKAHCLFAGLVEEYAEVTEESDKIALTSTEKEALKGELGDFCFKVYNLGYHFGYVEFEYDGSEAFNFEKHIPILAKISKKTARDDNGMMINPDRNLIFKYVLNLLHSYIIDICNDYGFNLSDVLSYNVEKLQSRLERGVIMGDGSNR